MNEKRLLSRVAAGDSRALAEIIETYSTYVCTIAANITIPPLQQEDVEEVASDAFLAVWKHAGACTFLNTAIWYSSAPARCLTGEKEPTT